MDRVQGNGKYSLDEQQRNEQGLKVKLTLKGYQANDPFPKLGHIYAPKVECTPILASTNCKRAEVSEISPGYLYVFNPFTIENKDVADYYGQTGLSLHATINDSGLKATSASGAKPPSASGVMGANNQTVQTDDERKDVVFAQDHAKSSSIRNFIQYSCLYEPNYFDDGSRLRLVECARHPTGNRFSHSWNSGTCHGRLQTSDNQAKSSTDSLRLRHSHACSLDCRHRHPQPSTGVPDSTSPGIRTRIWADSSPPVTKIMANLTVPCP